MRAAPPAVRTIPATPPCSNGIDGRHRALTGDTTDVAAGGHHIRQGLRIRVAVAKSAVFGEM